MTIRDRKPTHLWNGRPCFVEERKRVQRDPRRPQWGSYTVLHLRFTDGSVEPGHTLTEQVTEGRFNTKAKPLTTPKPTPVTLAEQDDLFG